MEYVQSEIRTKIYEDNDVKIEVVFIFLFS